MAGRKGSHAPTIEKVEEGIKVALTHGMTAGENEHYIPYIYI